VGAAPLTVTFDASASIVPDGAAEWYWNFGDGLSSTAGPIVSHRS
jgi:PKD repeat protein